MNFYKLYNLINEYGQSLMQTLIQKFMHEKPTLTPDIIKSYIDRFERIKNNLTSKDITTYTWKELENAVDGYQSKERIKAGKLDASMPDANLLYNQNKIRIYLGKDKKSCVKYGNGYSFCISSRGEDNMYPEYRLMQRGTPYFIFNDNLPPENPSHILVLFTYKNFNEEKYKFTITDAENKSEKGFNSIEDIIQTYPWTSPIKNFVDNNKKGHVEPNLIEKIEYWLTRDYNYEKNQIVAIHLDHFKGNIKKDGTKPRYEDEVYHTTGGGDNLWIDELVEESRGNKIEDVIDLLQNKKRIAHINPKIFYIDDSQNEIFLPGGLVHFFVIFNNLEELSRKMIKRIINESEYLNTVPKFKDSFDIKKLEKDLKENLDKNRLQELLNNNKNFKINDYFEMQFKSNFNFIIRIEVSSEPEIVVKALEESKEYIEKIAALKQQYIKDLNWVKNAPVEKLERIKREAKIVVGGWNGLDISKLIKKITG